MEPSFILLDQNFKNKSEALINLVEILHNNGCLNNKQKYLESIIEREKIYQLIVAIILLSHMRFQKLLRK